MKEANYLKENIIVLLERNKGALEIEGIIDYLDYINKIRYSEKEIIPLLKELVLEKRIRETKNSTYRRVIGNN